MTDPDESVRLAGRIQWHVITNAHGVALHVTCPLCGHNLVTTHNDHLLSATDSDSHPMWIGQEIEYCLRKHLGRDDDYPDGRGKRTCTAVAIYTHGLGVRYVLRAHDGTYWLETYRYNPQFDDNDWSLAPVTTEWIQRQVQETQVIAAAAQAKLKTLEEILAWLQAQV